MSLPTKPFHHLLSLSGYGFLQEIIQTNNKKIARIKAINHFEPSNEGKDEIWIDCEISDASQFAYLDGLLHSVRTDENSVMVTFDVEYSTFKEAYANQMPSDDSHIVTLQDKLKNLGDCYIDGCVIEQSKISLPLLLKQYF